MNVRLLGPARFDVIDLSDWYEQQSPGLGIRLESAVDGLIATLTAQPRLYARVPRPPAGREVRRGPVPGFLVLATYEVTASEVLIVAVRHARSRSRPWRSRLP